MTTVHEIPTQGRLRSAALTLTGEHSLPLRQVAIRAEDALAVIAESRWPTAELRALIGYHREEVLRQAGDEEWLLFPAREAQPGFARLSRDHVRLGANIDVLPRSAADRGACSPAQLAVTTRDLLAQLARHLAVEEALLATAHAPDEVPSTTGAPQPRPTADAPAERHARPAPGPEHADRAARIPDRWPFVLPAGWAWVRSADSPLAADGLSRAPGGGADGRAAEVAGLVTGERGDAPGGRGCRRRRQR